MTDTSGFSPRDNAPIPVVNLEVDSSTSCCYLVRLYGKLHFMKKLKPELASHPRYRAALQKEFEMGYSLSHPNLVRYVSRGDDYILMDYVDGETLQQFINNNPDYFNDPKNADRFVKQLLSVLGYLHSHHVVHLD
ncbi:MAG: protein kinase, partial [Muribaculaceae bacterium]|nr:protein kinase [Muribaculaceae bacterium]